MNEYVVLNFIFDYSPSNNLIIIPNKTIISININLIISTNSNIGSMAQAIIDIIKCKSLSDLNFVFFILLHKKE